MVGWLAVQLVVETAEKLVGMTAVVMVGYWADELVSKKV